MYEPSIVDAFVAVQPDLACALDRAGSRKEPAA